MNACLSLKRPEGEGRLARVGPLCSGFPLAEVEAGVFLLGGAAVLDSSLLALSAPDLVFEVATGSALEDQERCWPLC